MYVPDHQRRREFVLFVYTFPHLQATFFTNCFRRELDCEGGDSVLSPCEEEEQAISCPPRHRQDPGFTQRLGCGDLQTSGTNSITTKQDTWRVW